MLKSSCFAACLLLALSGPVSAADITVVFVEGAPKDSFTIRNNSGQDTSGCDVRITELTIDLAGSAGNLIFDTTSAGEGVSVFQPFELVAGSDTVSAVTEVSDGDQSVTFSFTGLKSGEFARFTIDVDDRLTDGPMGQTMVAGSEIEGATVRARLSTPGAPERALTTRFTGTRAEIALEPCVTS